MNVKSIQCFQLNPLSWKWNDLVEIIERCKSKINRRKTGQKSYRWIELNAKNRETQENEVRRQYTCRTRNLRHPEPFWLSTIFTKRAQKNQKYEFRSATISGTRDAFGSTTDKRCWLVRRTKCNIDFWCFDAREKERTKIAAAQQIAAAAPTTTEILFKTENENTFVLHGNAIQWTRETSLYKGIFFFLLSPLACLWCIHNFNFFGHRLQCSMRGIASLCIESHAYITDRIVKCFGTCADCTQQYAIRF